MGIPFFGICLGLQCAVIEFARNVCGLEEANSVEFDPSTKHPVIDIMEDQKSISDKGGTMRLGAYRCDLVPGSIAHAAYRIDTVRERHRHRYEVSNNHRDLMSEAGLKPTGVNPDRDLVEIIENPAHPWFVGVQFHPEFRSTVEHAHPLFTSFVEACLKHEEARKMASSGDGISAPNPSISSVDNG